METAATRSGGFVLALAFCALLTCRADASNGNPGRAAYFRYCSACHGADGTGNGELAATMRPKPSNLTQLAKTHGGTFPSEQVKEIIDGRGAIAAHGSSKMPVWGTVFGAERTAQDPEAHIRSQIQIIVDYLRAIQTN
jgi:mono/diheme cytochrome c family protein